MGVVSNGMLCSGEELRPDQRRRRDPDPAGRHAARRAAGRPLRRRRARRGRQAQPRRRAVDPGAGPRGRRGDRARRSGCRTSWSRRATALRPPSGSPSTSATPTCAPGSSARWVSGVTVGPSPDRVQMRLLAAGQRPVSERRRRLELRDARARQADPHVRRRRGPRRRRRAGHDRRASRAGGGAARDARPRRARAHARHAADRRPATARSASPASWAARRRRSADATTDVVDRVGDLRPGEHPADGPAARAALRGEQPVREGPGAAAGADRRRPHRPARRASGRAAWSPAAASTPRPTSRARRGSRSGPRAINRLLGHRAVGRRAAGRSWRGSGSRPSRPPGRAGDRRAPARAADRRRAGPRARRSARSPRSCPPGVATSRSRPTSPRRSPASAATSSSPSVTPDTAMPRLPPVAARGPRARPRDARRRRPDRGRHDRARVARATSRCSRLAGAGAVRRRRARSRRRADRASRNPLSRDHSLLRRNLLGSLLDVVGDEPAPRHRRRRGVRDRQGLRAGRRRAARVVAARVRAGRVGRAAGLEPPAAALRPRRRQGPARAPRAPARTSVDPAYRPESGEAVFHPGRTARADIARPPACPRRRAAPGDRRRLGAADGDAGDRRRGRDRGPGGGAADARSGRRRSAVTRRSTGTSRSSSPEATPAAAVEAVIRRRGGELLRDARLFDIYRGLAAGAGPRRASPSASGSGAATGRSPRPRSRRAVAAIVDGAAGDRRPAPRLTVRRTGRAPERAGPPDGPDPASHCGARSAAATLRRSSGPERAGQPSPRDCVDFADTLTQINVFDVVVILYLFGWFILGFIQGTIRRLLGIGVARVLVLPGAAAQRALAGRLPRRRTGRSTRRSTRS